LKARIEPGWWWRIPADFKEQMDMFCMRCGYPARLPRRSSIEGIDDISPKNMDRLKEYDFTKIKNGHFKISDCKQITEEELNQKPLAQYKDTDYRNEIAKRYDMFFVINDQGFWSPYLLGDKSAPVQASEGWKIKLGGQ
jgi:hypothetical protein